MLNKILFVLAILLAISLWQWVLLLAVIFGIYLLYVIWDIAGQESRRYRENAEEPKSSGEEHREV